VMAQVRRNANALNKGADQLILAAPGTSGIEFGLRNGAYVMNFGHRNTEQEIRSTIMNEAGKWERVAFVYGNGKAQIFVRDAAGNFRSSAKKVMTPYNLLTFSQDVYAGGAQAGDFPGIIRDVRIHSFAMSKRDLNELWGLNVDPTSKGWEVKCVPVSEPDSAWGTGSTTTKGTGICKKHLPLISQSDIHKYQVKAKGQNFVLSIDGKEIEKFVDSNIESGGIGLETWKATMHAANLKFDRSWISDDTIVKCTPMETQPTTPADTNVSPLTPEVAQQICDAFRGAGCGGFLFVSRATQELKDEAAEDVTGEPKASVVYCKSNSMLAHDYKANKMSPVGYYRAENWAVRGARAQK